MDALASGRAPLRAALVVMGFAATAAQILALRELLVTFHGNELCLGIVFGNWLLLEAAGSALARRAADRTARPAALFALLQALAGAGSLLSILIIRSFRYLLQLPTGEMLGLGYVAGVSLVALAPVAVADGALFPLGCRNLASLTGGRGAAGNVYLYQALGAVLAGLAFVLYLVHYLNPLEIAALLLLCSLAAAAWYLTALRVHPRLRGAVLGLLVAAGVATLFAGPTWLHRQSARLLWYEFPLLETRDSVYANIAVIRQKDQYTFFANGSPYATTPAPDPYLEELAHFPLLLHPDPRRVLVIGGGAGGLLEGVLRHPVGEVAYAEHDPTILEMFRQYSTPLTERELAHPVVRVHPVEGRLLLKTLATPFDVALLNLPIPSTLMLNRYYSVEFFDLAKRRLRPGGILAFRLPGSETFLAEEVRDLNRTIYASLRAVFGHVRILAGETNLFLASDGEAIRQAWDPEVLIRRLREREIEASLITPPYVRYKMDGARFGGLGRAIAEHGGRPPNTDGVPRGVLDAMRVLASVVSPFTARVLKAVEDLPALAYLVGGMLAILGLFGLQVARRSQLFLGYAVASTGFTGMLLSILLLFAFQIQHGYVYHYIGLLTALFMLGSGLGAYWAVRRPGTPLLAVELLTAALALLVPASLVVEGYGIPARQAIYLLMTLAGVMVGMQYPLVVGLADPTHRRIGGTAGRFYALDLCGAFVGAVATAVILIPTIGLVHTALLAALLKAGSALLVWVESRTGRRGRTGRTSLRLI